MEKLNLENLDDEKLQDKIKHLSSTCDTLLTCLHSGVSDSENRWKSIEQMYDKHVSELATTCMDLRTENGILKHKLTENDAKVTQILNENEYLRWENEQFGSELDALREQLDEENLLNKELQAEIKCLQLNQKQINHLHSSRLKDELTSARDVYSTKEDYYRRRIEDLERQHGLSEFELKNKIECLEDELADKKETIRSMEQKLNKTIKENKKINQEYMMFKKETESDMEKLYSRETELEAELAIVFDRLEPGSNLYSQEEVLQRKKILLNDKSVQKQKYEQEIQNFQKKIKLLEEFENEDSESVLRSKLNEKSLQVGDLRERIIFLEEELRLEKEQRQNATILLAQMGKDMKILLKAAKDA